jgi:hypothetical protein
VVQYWHRSGVGVQELTVRRMHGQRLLGFEVLRTKVF